MNYRTFKKTGEDVSLLGFGTMRFPLDPDGKIDQIEAIKMIRASIDKGVNYIDTAYMYHDGESEVVTGLALKDGYREKVLLADKMPVWMAKDQDAMKAIFDEQFKRLDVDCIDMYLIHNLTTPIWKMAQSFKVLEFLEEKRTEGKIKHIGFSFHDELPLFKEIIDAYNWDFCQIQLNYMDKEYQAGVEGLKYAASKQIPVVIMEPLKGGRLTDALPPTVASLWATADVKRSPAEWALRWVADFPEVLTILSGVTTMAQLEENIKVLAEAKPSSLTEKEHEIINLASKEYNNLIKYSCTGCKYCMPCPQKLNIPVIIGLYNEWFLYEGSDKTKGDFGLWVSPKRRPSTCTSCNACQDHCPQHLPISDIMKGAAKVFE